MDCYCHCQSQALTPTARRQGPGWENWCRPKVGDGLPAGWGAPTAWHPRTGPPQGASRCLVACRSNFILSIMSLGDDTWKRAAGRKGARLPSAPSCSIFAEQDWHTCALKPLQPTIAGSRDEEETQAVSMLSSPWGLVAAALPAGTPACPTVHRNAPGQHTWSHNAPEKSLSSSLIFVRKNIFLTLGEKTQWTFSYPSAQASGGYEHIWFQSRLESVLKSSTFLTFFAMCFCSAKN